MWWTSSLFQMQMTGKRPASFALLALAFFVAACGGSDSSVGSASDADAVESAEASESTDAAEASDSTDAAEASDAVAIAGLEGEFATVDGSTLDLATLQGEDVVLWFWAPW